VLCFSLDRLLVQDDQIAPELAHEVRHARRVLEIHTLLPLVTPGILEKAAAARFYRCQRSVGAAVDRP
jgi:hypothetical protein